MVLRSKSVGEQDVADQQGAFFYARLPSGGRFLLARLPDAVALPGVKRTAPLARLGASR